MANKQRPEYKREWQQKRRKLVLKLLGDKCTRCGFTDHRALQVDHVNGNGCADRRNKNSRDGYYTHILKGIPEGKFQLLCANCNWIKRAEKGEHFKALSAGGAL